jgi:hypothetical protein
MRLLIPCTLAAALAAALPIPASAQQAGAPPSQPAPAAGASTTDSPPPPAQTPAPTSSTSSADTTSSNFFTTSPSHWVAAGFVGANYGARTANSSVDFGGQAGYLYRGVVGGEFLADFAPTFEINNAFLAERPFVNAYMANAIVAAPLGSDHQIQPYVSGGFGGIQLRGALLSSLQTSSQTTANQTRGGGDIGFGVMGFAGSVGVRGDVRYFRAFTNDTLATGTTTPGDAFSQNLLSGLDFWRANIGVAVRW